MIEQYTPGLQQVSQSAAPPYRDRQATADQDDQSGSFEDFVKAGERPSQQADQRQGDDDTAQKPVADTDRPVEISPKIAFELSAALRGFGAATTTATANANAATKQQTFKDALKGGDRTEQTGKQAEVALAKLVEKMKQAAQVEQAAANATDADDQQPMTASDELSLLLGLTASKDVDAKQGKKSTEQADKTEKKADADDKASDAIDKKTEAHGADPMLMTVDARHGGKDADADDNASSSRSNDLVRLVNANGRGGSVDITVSVPGTQAQDSSKSSSNNTPKVETATVLEARRYLGFSTDTNATALATAIKSDPTWTGALQSTQRTDLSGLGNTVTEVNTLKIEMNPEHLGSMVASLKLKGEELTVELRVNSVEAYHHLTADHDDIVKGLQDQGFSIDKVTVQLNATDRTDTGADRDLSRQGQRDDQAAQREGQGGSNDSQREQSRWASANDRADNAAGDNSADAGRAGNIYL